jgi:gluconolactonase
MRVSFDIVTDGLEFPEGPVACADGTTLVVEVAAGRITRVSPNGRKQLVAQVCGGPNGLAFGPDGALYCCNNGGAIWGELNGYKVPVAPLPDYAGGLIQRIEPTSGKIETLYGTCDGRKLAAPNDIVFDRKGGFWFTDYGRSADGYLQEGGLYYAHTDGSFIRRVAQGSHFNGVGLSPDGNTVYAALTEQRWILAFDANPRADPALSTFTAKLIADFRRRCFPDSLAIEADGTIAQACTLEQAGIVRVNPTAGVMDALDFGDIFTTNIAFGGEDMRTAYVTLAASGCLAKANWPAAGLVLAYNG